MMKKHPFVKPTLTLIASALMILTGHTMAQSNASHSAPVTLSQAANQQAQQDAQLLISAVAGNRLSVIEQLVSEGVNINTPAIGDGTALMLAVKDNNLAMVKDLVALGADVNQPSAGDGNPIIVASQQGHLAIVKYLLQQNADINAIVEGDETPLINASRSGHLTIVKWLVAQGADVNLAVRASTLTGMVNRSPLNQAATGNIRSYLVSQGATQ